MSACSPGDSAWHRIETDPELRVHALQEIVHVLGDIMGRGALVTVHFNAGSDFALTSIAAVSARTGELLLDPGPDDTVNQRWLSATDMLFVANQGQVKIKFTSDRITLTRYRDRPAFAIPIPTFLVRLQRREYFRVATSLVNPVTCLVPLPEPGCEARLMVIDISIGGVALLDNHHALDLDTGSAYERCRIDLPNAGLLQVTLEVRNTAEVTMKGGPAARRAGCRFVDLPPRAESLVQRYIMDLELKRDLRRR